MSRCSTGSTGSSGLIAPFLLRFLRLLHLVETIVRHPPVQLLQPEKDDHGSNADVHDEVEDTHTLGMQVVVNGRLVPTCGVPPGAAVGALPRTRRLARPG